MEEKKCAVLIVLHHHTKCFYYISVDDKPMYLSIANGVSIPVECFNFPGGPDHGKYSLVSKYINPDVVSFCQKSTNSAVLCSSHFLP